MPDESETTGMLPCPFCGGYPEISKHFKEATWRLLHQCPIIGPVAIDWTDSEERLRARWNIRQTADEIRFEPPLPLPLDATSGQLFVRLCRVHAALAQLLLEVIDAEFETITDGNWHKAISDAKQALKDVY